MGGREKNMRVRKNKKKITELKNHMETNGEMPFSEIKHWMNERTRNGVTSNWLANVLAKCGLFEKVGSVQTPGIYGSSRMTIWGGKSDEA